MENKEVRHLSFRINILIFTKKPVCARLAQSVEHETLNLRVVGSSPTLGANSFCLFFIP